jgi:phosphatidylglycerophosphatase C
MAATTGEEQMADPSSTTDRSTLPVQPSAPGSATGGSASTPVIIWDVDLTLSRYDTLIPFLGRLMGRAWLARAVVSASGHAVRGRTAASQSWRTRFKSELLRSALAGRELAGVDEIAQRYAVEIVTRGIRADSLRRWLWHSRRGERLVLASASPDLYLRHLGTALGAADVISTEMEIVDGVLTGRMATENCRGVEKARRIRDYLVQYPGSQVWMYTDSRSDLPSLALADVAIRVRPHRVLRTPPIEPAAHSAAVRPVVNIPLPDSLE